MKTIIIYSEIDWEFLEQRHHFVARFLEIMGLGSFLCKGS